MTRIATYRAEYTWMKEGYVSSFIQGNGGTNSKGNFIVTFLINDQDESIVYQFEKAPTTILWLTEDEFAAYNARSNRVAFRPVNEAGSFGASGFVLPLAKSHLMTKPYIAGENGVGEPCEQEGTNCNSLVVTLHLNGARQIAQWEPLKSTLSCKIVGPDIGTKQILGWTYSSKDQFPERFEFSENSFEGVSATVRFSKLEDREVNQKIKTRQWIREGAKSDLVKGRVAYGGEYNPNVKPMAEFENQKQMWAQAQIEPKNNSKAGVTIGISMLTIACAILIWKRLRK